MYIDQHRRLIGVIVVYIVRRELKIPFQFSRVRFDCQYTSCIEIVTGAGISHKIGCRVAGGPEQGVKLRIICAGHPGCGTSVQIGITWPTGGSEFSRPRNSPETPFQLASQRIIGGDKSAHTGVSAGGADDNRTVHNKGSAGCSVMLGLVGISNVPAQATGAS